MSSDDFFNRMLFLVLLPVWLWGLYYVVYDHGSILVGAFTIAVAHIGTAILAHYWVDKK